MPRKSQYNIDTGSLAEMLNTVNLHQLMNFPTHKVGNILDLIIHRAEQNCIQNITRSDSLSDTTRSDSLSDHCIIEWTMIRDHSQTVKIETVSRNIKDIDIRQFETDLKNKIELPRENDNMDDMYQNYLKNIISIIDKHAPITRRQLTKKKTQNMVWQGCMKTKDPQKES